MKPGQTDLPRQWLIADDRLGAHLWDALRALPSGSGILFLYCRLQAPARRKLLAEVARLARRRGLILVDEAAGDAARVHNVRELRTALYRQVPLILLSPMRPTESHPDWLPIPRMRAAALARLAGRRLVALGGMDEARFRRIESLGFLGWAGIDAFARRGPARRRKPPRT